MWRTLLNTRKMQFTTQVNKKRMEDTYEGFYEREKYIPKIQGTHNRRGHGPSEDNKTWFEYRQFPCQIEILHKKNTTQLCIWEKYDELQSEIVNVCHLETHDFLEDLWLRSRKLKKKNRRKSGTKRTMDTNSTRKRRRVQKEERKGDLENRSQWRNNKDDELIKGIFIITSQR